MAISPNIQVLDPRALRDMELLMQWRRRTGQRRAIVESWNARDDTPDAQSVPIYNDVGSEIPQFGIIELGALLSDGVLHNADKPAYSSISRYAIACTPIPIASPGRAWIVGIHPVLIILKDGESIAIRDHVRPHKNSHYGRIFELGPMIVESVIGDDSNDTGDDLLTSAWVAMTEERGDHKLADTGGVADGAYQAFALSAAYAVAAGEVGRPAIDLA